MRAGLRAPDASIAGAHSRRRKSSRLSSPAPGAGKRTDVPKVYRVLYGNGEVSPYGTATDPVLPAPRPTPSARSSSKRGSPSMSRTKRVRISVDATGLGCTKRQRRQHWLVADCGPKAAGAAGAGRSRPSPPSLSVKSVFLCAEPPGASYASRCRCPTVPLLWREILRGRCRKRTSRWYGSFWPRLQHRPTLAERRVDRRPYVAVRSELAAVESREGRVPDQGEAGDTHPSVVTDLLDLQSRLRGEPATLMPSRAVRAGLRGEDGLAASSRIDALRRRLAALELEIEAYESAWTGLPRPPERLGVVLPFRRPGGPASER